MKHRTKTIRTGATACAAALVLGLTAAPAMAQAPAEDTAVEALSVSSQVAADGDLAAGTAVDAQDDAVGISADMAAGGDDQAAFNGEADDGFLGLGDLLDFGSEEFDDDGLLGLGILGL